MKRVLLFWFVKRIAVPVSWYGTAVFVVGAAAPSRLVEFLTGAFVLLAWAFLADWPFSGARDRDPKER